MQRVTEKRELESAVSGGRHVVMFHATWCPFCVRFKPEFVEGTRHLQGWEALECIIDDEDNPLWMQHHIQAVPTLIAFENGRPTARLDARLGIGLTGRDLAKFLADTGARPAP